MKDDQKRVSSLLIQTVSLLCKNGLHFEKNLHIQGLLGITVDEKDVFIVQIDENLWQKPIDKPLSDASELNQISLSTNENQLIQSQNSPQKVDNQVDNNESFENYNSSFSPRQSESFELNKNDNLSRNNDNFIFIKTEMSESMDKKDQEDSNLMSCQEPNQNFHNELVPINQVSQPFANNFHINSLANITQRTVSERGRKKRNHKRAGGSFNLSPIENLENSLLPSYDNFHPYKNDDLVKESWTYTKYHTSKHSPKNQLPSNNNYLEDHNLLLYNNERTENQFNLNNNSSEQNIISNHNRNNLPRRRSNMKTVVCQYPDCGKTFCHSCHLYRHQRLKHGHRFGVVAQASFKCQYNKCGKVFYRRSSLINHCLHVHQTPPESFSQPSQYPSQHPLSNHNLIDNSFMGNKGQDNAMGDTNDTINERTDIPGCSEYIG